MYRGDPPYLPNEKGKLPSPPTCAFGTRWTATAFNGRTTIKNSTTALVSHNFVSTQYLKNKLIEFHQILYMILTRPRLGLLYIIFHTFVMVLWPLIDVIISFLLNKSTEFYQILYMHSYWQNLGWDYYQSYFTWFVRISFPLNILRTNWQNFTEFYVCIHIDNI